MINPDINLQQTVQERSFRQRLSDTYYMAGAEMANSDLFGRFILGAAASGVAFEWGPGNEYLIGDIGATVHSSQKIISSSIDFITSSLNTGLASGGVSAAEQLLVGSVTALAIRKFRGTANAWNNTDDNVQASNNLRGSVADTLALGTSAAVVLRNFKEKDRKLGQDISLVAKGAAMVGMFNVGLIGAVSAGVRALDEAGMHDTASAVESTAKNPLTYVAGFGIIKLIGHFKKQKKSQQA